MTDHQEEMLALHALRTLTPEEVRLLQSESRYDARMRETLEEFEDVAAEIARLVPEEAPPEELRAQLLTRLKVHARGNVTPFSTPFRLLRSPVIAWAAAAVIAVGAVGLWTKNVQLDKRVVALTQSETDAQGQVKAARDAQSDLQKQVADATSKISSLNGELENVKQSFAASNMKLAMLQSSLARYEGTRTAVAWNQEKQEGLLKIENMPEVPVNKDYQLWVICKQCQHPVNAGVVKVTADGTTSITFKPIKHIAEPLKFAISVEAQGGAAETPAGQIIFASR